MLEEIIAIHVISDDLLKALVELKQFLNYALKPHSILELGYALH